MKLINIGYGNMVSAGRVVAIVSPESAPAASSFRALTEPNGHVFLFCMVYYTINQRSS